MIPIDFAGKSRPIYVCRPLRQMCKKTPQKQERGGPICSVFVVVVIYLKCFDTTDHRGRLFKLGKYDIQGNELEWLKTIKKTCSKW